MTALSIYSVHTEQIVLCVHKLNKINGIEWKCNSTFHAGALEFLNFKGQKTEERLTL